MIKMVDVKEYLRKEVIRRCPYCYQDMTIKKGLTSENIKRLFRRPTVEDFIMLFIIFLTIVSFLVYTYEVKAYKIYINENCPIGIHNQQSSEISLPQNLDINKTLFNNESKAVFELNNTKRDDEKG